MAGNFPFYSDRLALDVTRDQSGKLTAD